MLGDAQMPERVGYRQGVACLRRELQGPFEGWNRSAVVVPDYLVEYADPEQRLALAADVAEYPVESRRALEKRQLARVLVLPFERSRVHYPAAGKGEIRLHPV
jgi:hypothetical protein